MNQLAISRTPDQRYWLTLASESSDTMVEVTQQQAEQILAFLGGRAGRSPKLHPRARIRYPFPDEPGRFEVDINGDPTEGRRRTVQRPAILPVPERSHFRGNVPGPG